MVSPLVVVFPGNAELTGNAVADLYTHIPGFRTRLLDVCDLTRDLTGLDLLPLLLAGPAGVDLAADRLAEGVARNISIFAISVSVGRLLIDAGLQPSALVGYSLGEITAATVAGVFTLEDAVRLVIGRSECLEEAVGSMLGVCASPASMPWSEQSGEGVNRPGFDVAIEVTPNLTVLSGDGPSIAREHERLRSHGVDAFPLRVDRAAHSWLLDRHVATVEQLAASCVLRPGSIPVVNGETGLFDDGAMGTAAYWGRHLRRTRNFAASLETVSSLGSPVIIEAGPASLSALLQRSPDPVARIVPSVPHGSASGVAQFFELLSELERTGHRVSLDSLVARGAGVGTRVGRVGSVAAEAVRPIGRTSSDAVVAPASEPSTVAISAVFERSSEVLSVASRSGGIGEVLEILTSALPGGLGPDEHFFEAGGNSLLAMEALARVEQRWGVRIALREFLRGPTATRVVRLLAEQLEATPDLVESLTSPSLRPVDSVASEPRKQGNVVPRLSLQFFAGDVESDPGDRYGLLLEVAQAADAAGLHALWFPERHFNRFGGLYPSAPVLAAAVAAVTTRIRLRGGSVVAPLHHPVRIAEEWAMVDNLSGGRAGISFGSGFVPRDFVLAPESFEKRKQVMFDAMSTVRAIWSGEEFRGPGGTGLPTGVAVLPRPVQPEIPLWLSTTRDIETFVEAGELGVGVLTALLRLSVEELTERIGAYRAARRRAGHQGPGAVTLMVHTFVGSDAHDVARTTHEPLRQYIRAHMEHTRDMLDSRSGQSQLSSRDEEELLDHAQDRYLTTAGMFGTRDRCRERLREFAQAGVDEVACLLDFGISRDAVLRSIEQLGALARETTPVAGR